MDGRPSPVVRRFQQTLPADAAAARPHPGIVVMAVDIDVRLLSRRRPPPAAASATAPRYDRTNVADRTDVCCWSAADRKRRDVTVTSLRRRVAVDRASVGVAASSSRMRAGHTASSNCSHRPTTGAQSQLTLTAPCQLEIIFIHHTTVAALLHGIYSGRQPNFAALNRGRHLCSTGQPSRWAMAHILVITLCIGNYRTVGL